MAFSQETADALHNEINSALQAAANSWTNLESAGEFNYPNAKQAADNLYDYIEHHFITLDYETDTTYDPASDNMQIKVACLNLAAARSDVPDVVEEAKDYYKWIMKTDATQTP